MIDISHCKRLITHDSCGDGYASARIIHSAMPNIEVRFVQYDSPEHHALLPHEGDLFCDMTPPRSGEKIQSFVQAGAIVLDHHEHAKDIVDAFGERGVYSDEPGVSGAVLAYRAVSHSFKQCATLGLSRLAAMAGVYDTWQKDSPLWSRARAQNEVLLLQGRTGIHFPPALDSRDFDYGYLLDAEKIEEARKLAKEAFHVGDFVFVNTRRTNDVAEALRASGCDKKALVGFSYRTDTLGIVSVVYSLRSLDDGFDVGAIALANGGGGHAQAAGFSKMLTQEMVRHYSPIDLFFTRD